MSVQTYLWSSNVNGRQVRPLYREAGTAAAVGSTTRGSVYQSVWRLLLYASM